MMRSVTVYTVALLALTAGAASAGAPASTRRDATLPHACRGGAATGAPCASDADCAPGRCVLVAQSTKFTALVTFIVDDHVSQFDGSEDVSDVVAVTAVVEIARGGNRLVLAQVYQNLAGDDLATLVANLQAGPFIADTGNSNRRVTEASLNGADTAALLDDFLFQQGDDEMTDALRAFYGTTGVPVVAKAERLERWDQGGTGLASLVRLKVRGRFVQQ
jgi:hypothetical protein